MSINVYVLSQHSTILIVLFTREIRAILTLMRNFYKSRLRKANTLNIWFVLVFPSTGIYMVASSSDLYCLPSIFGMFLCAAWTCPHSLKRLALL